MTSHSDQYGDSTDLLLPPLVPRFSYYSSAQRETLCHRSPSTYKTLLHTQVTSSLACYLTSFLMIHPLGFQENPLGLQGPRMTAKETKSSKPSQCPSPRFALSQLRRRHRRPFIAQWTKSVHGIAYKSLLPKWWITSIRHNLRSE